MADQNFRVKNGLEVGIGATILVATNAGRIGIKTTDPKSALDVRGSISIGRTDAAGINSIRSVVDINSWEYYGVFKLVSGEDTAPVDIFFKNDGTKMYILGDTGNDVNEYLLSTPWEVNTATFTTNFSVAAQDTNPAGLYFKPDGTRMYICGTTGVTPLTGDRVYSYTLSNPWSLVGVTTDTVAGAGTTFKNFNSGANDTVPQGVYFKDDGTKMYVVGATGDAVYEYTVSTAWEIDSTVTLNYTLLIGTANTQNLPLTLTNPTGIDFNDTGTKMYITDSTRDVVSRFDLSIGWDLSTATFYDNVYIGFQELTPTGIFYQEDQSKAYIVGSSSDTVYQYNTDVPSLELASSGISTRSSIILNNEARLNNRLYVTDVAHFSSNTTLKGTLTVDGASTLTGNVTTAGNITVSGGTITAGNVAASLLTGNTTTNVGAFTALTSGTLTIGGTNQTGTMTIGRSTQTHTLDIASAVSGSGNQKTINLGTGGASGSRTLITVGSATAGAISTVTIPSPTNLLIGTATTTGTASQRLQVTGGAYVSDNLGVGVTNPDYKLHVNSGTTNTALLLESTDTTVALSMLDNTTTTTDNYHLALLRSGDDTRLWSGNAEAIRIDSTQKVGINSTTPTARLDVVGDAKVSGVVTATTFIGDLTGTATTATNLSDAANITTGTISDNRLPDLITSNININSGVSTFLAVKATTFEGSLTGNASSATYASTAGVATALQNSRTFEITGDIIASPISFNGTGNVSLAATIQPNSVGLGTDTFGDYVQSVSGTSNQITVTSGTGEGSTPTLSIPSQFTAPQDVTVTRDLQVNRNLNVTGNITIGGTSATIFSQSLNIFDPDIVLGYRTDGSGNDVSNDNTANHGGVALASTEGTPLVDLFIAGIETNPATYKKIMWFKSGTFSGLGTDAWLSNYAVGIGSTQVPNGVRLAAGSVQFTERDLSVIRNINSSGVVTATTFVGALTGSATSTTNIPNLTGDVTSNNTVTTLSTVNSNVGTYGGTGAIPVVTVNAKGLVTGVSTVAPNNGTLTLAVSGTGLSGSATFTANQSGNSTFTVTSNATSVNTVSTIVARDVSGNFSAGTITANLTGTATTATNLSDAANITTGTISSGRLTGSYNIDITGNAATATTAGTATTATNLSDAANITTGTISSGRLTGSYNIDITGNAATATTAGIATYAISSGIATNLKGGAGGSIPYQSSTDTTVFLANGTPGQILQSNGGTSAPSWVSAAPADAITGITIRDEGVIAGSASSISQINFVGSNVSATASGGISTITVSDNLVGTALSISGISTFVGVSTFKNDLYVNGNVSVTGILTAQRIFSSTYGEFVGGSISGTNLVGTALSISGISTFSINSSSDAFTITQTGSGNALVVEDSTNPDSTPFVVNASGSVGIGTTNPGALLHLQSTSPIIRFTDSDGFNNFKHWNMGVNAGELFWQARTDTDLPGNQFFKMVRNSEQIETFEGINTGSTWFIINNATQRVGINSTSATSRLDVGGDVKVSGVVTATSFTGSGTNLTGIVTYITAGSGISVDQSTGNVTITATGGGGGGGGGGEFNTGITSSVQLTPYSYESSVFTFPSTSGKQYVIESISVANVDTSVGVGTTVNIIASIQNSTGEQTYIAYNVPIVTGGLLELLKNPMVAGPNDVIKMWVTNTGYIGVNNAVEVYMNYDEFTSTEYISEYAATVSIATTDLTTVYTSSTYPTVLESIHLANRTDSGDYPVSVTITNGITTTYLARDLIIPRYATVDILDRPKRVELNGTIGIKVGQTSTIDVIVAGKQIT